ncbi:MAG: hypothetical protein VX255_08585 [Candidatus Latescibacterota bacterium]|nr:hypothetical protein [Candidatus Latescibacterota bacterium]
MYMRWVVVLGWMMTGALTAQQEVPPPCQSPEARQFDFWVGHRQVSWGGQGTNTVSSDLRSCVIVERFDGRPGTPLVGMSVSTFDVRAQQWKQTWVDNQGGYLDFTGGWQDDRMILHHDAERDGPLDPFRSR